MASEAFMTISRDEVERMRLESEFKYELDTQSRMTYARQEGIREGERKGQLEILKLIKAGCSLEEIKARLRE
ncbi:MAG: hypothetical protein LBT00_10700 [Spirochaetaceae bacterium]|jgi:hypothetical protein|nr:hypothetical protein [Spirochaetaceae bacterium]